MLKRTRTFLLSVLFAVMLPAVSFAASWVNFPASWDLGQAFAVSITSNADYSQPIVTWMNRSVVLNVEQGGAGKISYGLLGSDVRNVKPGGYPILFEFVQGGKKYKASGNITIRAKEYPKEKPSEKRTAPNPRRTKISRHRSPHNDSTKTVDYTSSAAVEQHNFDESVRQKQSLQRPAKSRP